MDLSTNCEEETILFLYLKNHLKNHYNEKCVWYQTFVWRWPVKNILTKNINSTRNNFIDFTELQFIWGNQSIETHSLGPNLWISHDWEYRYPSVHHRCPKKNGPHNLITVFLWIQIAIDKIQLCSLSVAYACPYHNPTGTMGALCSQRWHQQTAHPHDTIHMICGCEAGWRTVKFSKTTLEAAYGREINIKFSGNRWTFLLSPCQMHTPST